MKNKIGILINFLIKNKKEIFILFFAVVLILLLNIFMKNNNKNIDKKNNENKILKVVKSKDKKIECIQSIFTKKLDR